MDYGPADQVSLSNEYFVSDPRQELQRRAVQSQERSEREEKFGKLILILQGGGVNLTVSLNFNLKQPFTMVSAT